MASARIGIAALALVLAAPTTAYAWSGWIREARFEPPATDWDLYFGTMSALGPSTVAISTRDSGQKTVDVYDLISGRWVGPTIVPFPAAGDWVTGFHLDGDDLLTLIDYEVPPKMFTAARTGAGWGDALEFSLPPGMTLDAGSHAFGDGRMALEVVDDETSERSILTFTRDGDGWSVDGEILSAAISLFRAMASAT